MQYLQRVLDSGTGGYCYYSKSFNDPTPLPSETSPNYTGSISAHSILSVTPDAGSGSGAGSTFVWTANGNLNSYPLSTAGALDGAATAAIASEAGRLDGFRAVLAAGLIANCRIGGRTDREAPASAVAGWCVEAARQSEVGRRLVRRAERAASSSTDHDRSGVGRRGGVRRADRRLRGRGRSLLPSHQNGRSQGEPVSPSHLVGGGWGEGIDPGQACRAAGDRGKMPPALAHSVPWRLPHRNGRGRRLLPLDHAPPRHVGEPRAHG